MSVSVKREQEQSQVERADGGGTCGDEASLRTMQAWQDGAARPTLQVEGTWGGGSQVQAEGAAFNQVFPLNVHRNVKTYEISVSAACCHHLPVPKGTHYVVRSCSSVSHGPVPSWVEHRGACVQAPAWHWAQVVGSHLTPVSTGLRRILIPPETQAQTETLTAAASHGRRAYRRDAGLGHDPLIKMENPGLHGCVLINLITRLERKTSGPLAHSVCALISLVSETLTANSFLGM